MLKVVFVVLALFVVGCAPEVPELTAVIEDDVSPECVAAILEAHDFWTERLGYAPFAAFRVVSNGEQREQGYREVVFGIGGKRFSGLGGRTADGEGRIHSGSVHFRSNEACRMDLAAHEMGHVFGVPHRSDDAMALMNHNVRGTVLTDDEIEIAHRAFAPF